MIMLCGRAPDVPRPTQRSALIVFDILGNRNHSKLFFLPYFQAKANGNALVFSGARLGIVDGRSSIRNHAVSALNGSFDTATRTSFTLTR